MIVSSVVTDVKTASVYKCPILFRQDLHKQLCKCLKMHIRFSLICRLLQINDCRKLSWFSSTVVSYCVFSSDRCPNCKCPIPLCLIRDYYQTQCTWGWWFSVSIQIRIWCSLHFIYIFNIHLHLSTTNKILEAIEGKKTASFETCFLTCTLQLLLKTLLLMFH